MVKVILISQFPLPYNKIASWTNMYNYLLSNSNHYFDYILCPDVQKKDKDTTYSILRNVSFYDKIKAKFLDSSHRYSNYLEALESIIEGDTKYILHIIDNSGVVLPIHRYLKNNYDRNNFYLQYYYQGFAPLFSRRNGQPFLYAIDEFFFLTHLAYKEYLNYYDDCTFRVRIMNNATDSRIFKGASEIEKKNIRSKYTIGNTSFVFMWCSQDRAKKGLHIVLEAFEIIHKRNQNSILLVVGINRAINQEGVIVIGRVPNNELPKYYQMSDVYLFPSLWKEGFGIVLAEALKCGCYAIASNQGGIPEVLNNGKYGVLIEWPNVVEEWVKEMERAIEIFKTNKGNPYLDTIPHNLYDVEDWCEQINLSIEEAKLFLNKGNKFQYY